MPTWPPAGQAPTPGRSPSRPARPERFGSFGRFGRAQRPRYSAISDTAAGTACTQRILRLAVAAPYTPATSTQIRKKYLKPRRSEEHTSELQSPCNLVCRLLLEKKKTRKA